MSEATGFVLYATLLCLHHVYLFPHVPFGQVVSVFGLR